MKRNILIKSIVFLILNFFVVPQTIAQTKTLSLEQAIELAKQNSPSYYRAKNTYENRYWRYRNFKAGLLPQLRLSTSFPNISRSISPITQPDGSIIFNPISQSNSSINVGLTQNIGFTGGQLTFGSSLQRIDIFGDSLQTSYLSQPFSIGYRQNSLLYNPFKWNRKIEPLRFQESEKGYNEAMEQVAVESTDFFFRALAAQINVEIAKTNKANTDTLYRIAKGRFSLGKIAENDLLQFELSVLNAQNDLAQAELDLQIASQNFKRYLNLDLNEAIDFIVPYEVKNIEIDPQKAISEAQVNRQDVLAFRRRRLEAEQNIAQTKGQNSVNLNLFANFGTAQTAQNFDDVYINPSQQQQVLLNLSIPLWDWGVRRSQIYMAKANQELAEVDIRQDEINFEQEIFLQVSRFNMQKRQLLIAQKSDTIAQKRLLVTKKRYLIGKISITDLNIALRERVQAQQGYINSLRTYWMSYYTLRRLTLYDFEKGEKILIGNE